MTWHTPATKITAQLINPDDRWCGKQNRWYSAQARSSAHPREPELGRA